MKMLLALDSDRILGLTGMPSLQSRRAVCVDYSAGNGGSLVAYASTPSPNYPVNA